MSSISLHVFHHHCFIMPPDLLCGCSHLSAYEGFWTPLWTLFKFFLGLLKHKINSLLIWLIISWMNSNCQLILSGLPVSWLLLLQNINDWLSVALHSQRRSRASALFRGHTLELCYACRLPNDYRLITALNPRGCWIKTALTSSRGDTPSVMFADDCAFQAVASSPESPFGIMSCVTFLFLCLWLCLQLCHCGESRWSSLVLERVLLTACVCPLFYRMTISPTHG